MSEQKDDLIIINGKTLTPAEAMAVRVAITDFHSEMSQGYAFGLTADARVMSEAYRDRLGEVLKLMFEQSIG